MNIGNRIKSERKASGLSQKDLSDKMGLSVTAISNWENGKNDVNGENLVQLAGLLAVSVSWLQTGRCDRHDATATDVVNADPLKSKWSDYYDKLTSNQRLKYMSDIERTLSDNAEIFKHLSKK